MAIYTVGRGRVIVALLLSAALLVTLDLRGNPVLDVAREGFARAMEPVERASDVVTNPVQRAWHSYQSYDDLERENAALRDQLDRQRGTQAAAEAAIIDYNLLLGLQNLDSLAGIDTAVAQVVGGASNNIDQIVEINVGTDDGVRVGMPVVNQAGLIGRITEANQTTSKVMLITDPRYSVPVEILGGTGAATDDGDVTIATTPSGRTDDENLELAEQSEAPEPGSPDDVFANEPSLPQAGDDADPVVPVGDDGQPAVTTSTLPPAIPVGGELPTTTTTTVPAPELLEKEFGVLRGNGEARPPQIRFVQDIPSLAVLQVGDLVETSGGSESLAPPNIPVGRVINRADRPGVAGPLLEIELNADLEKLNFVRVVLFRPRSEIEE
ncbi:MAG: rod shape-determining protein MreC [Ilumatobacter sp.]